VVYVAGMVVVSMAAAFGGNGGESSLGWTMVGLAGICLRLRYDLMTIHFA